jgi:putative ABC transport system substrate-binding protein
MNRWLFAIALVTGTFLAGMFFEAMGESGRRTVDFDKFGGMAFCRVVSDAKSIAGPTQTDLEQRTYLQTARRLVIFKKILSGAGHFLVLYSDTSQGAPITFVREAAERLGVELIERPVKTAVDLKAALERTKIDKVDGIFHIPDEWVNRHADLLFETARMRKLPTMTFSKADISKGALASYGIEFYRCELRKGRPAKKISKVDGSTDLSRTLIKRSFVEINLKTAKEIGFTIPAKLLQRADKELNELIARRML